MLCSWFGSAFGSAHDWIIGSAAKSCSHCISLSAQVRLDWKRSPLLFDVSLPVRFLSLQARVHVTSQLSVDAVRFAFHSFRLHRIWVHAFHALRPASYALVFLKDLAAPLDPHGPPASGSQLRSPIASKFGNFFALRLAAFSCPFIFLAAPIWFFTSPRAHTCRSCCHLSFFVACLCLLLVFAHCCA